MRPHRVLSPCRRRPLGIILAGALALSSLGCHQHYYYYGNPPCPPCSPPPNTVQYGSVCEVPTQVVDGGTTLSDSSSRSTTVSGSRTPPRVVVSEPQGQGPFSWRRSDPDGGATTTVVDGALEDSAVKR